MDSDEIVDEKNYYNKNIVPVNRLIFCQTIIVSKHVLCVYVVYLWNDQYNLILPVLSIQHILNQFPALKS